jgi:hypothetical protein
VLYNQVVIKDCAIKLSVAGKGSAVQIGRTADQQAAIIHLNLGMTVNASRNSIGVPQVVHSHPLESSLMLIFREALCQVIEGQLSCMVLLKRMFIGMGRKNQNYTDFFSFIALDPVVEQLGQRSAEEVLIEDQDQFLCSLAGIGYSSHYGKLPS